MELRTNRVLLREVEDRDIELIMRGFNEDGIRKYLGDNPYPFTEKDAMDEVKYCQCMSLQSTRVYYPFIIDFQNQGIGEVVLSGVNNSNELKPIKNSAYLSIWLVPEFHRMGIASEVIRKIAYFSFNDLELEFLSGDVAKENVASWSLLDKLGFTRLSQDDQFSNLVSPRWDREKDFLYILKRNH
jgi:RimJ/RimL family protein N-acetyltransferase